MEPRNFYNQKGTTNFTEFPTLVTLKKVKRNEESKEKRSKRQVVSLRTRQVEGVVQED